EELARALWSLQVFFGALTHKDIPQESFRKLALELGGVFGPSLREKATPQEIKAQAEELFAKQCYRNTPPTAKKSLDHALVMRGLWIDKFPQYLSPAFRVVIDVDLIAEGLSRGDDAWPKLEPILKTCLESDDVPTGQRIAALYEKAAPAVAAKMEGLLATK